MNILIFSWRGPGHPNAGGAEVATHEHAKGWIKAGHQVTLFTSYYPKAEEKENIDEVHFIRKGSQTFGVYLQAFWWYIFGKHQQLDLVIDQFHGIPFFTPLFIREKKLAFIHEVTKEVWGLNPWIWPFNLIPKALGPIFEPLIFRLYRNVPFMTVSDSTKSDLISFGIPDKNVTIIHNGITALDKKNLSKEKKKTLIFLGALTRDKGIEDALQVFSILSRISTDWQFWVVGKSDPRYLNKLRLLSNRLQLKGKIKFWGYVDEQKKFELLARAHILINPSIREGWGLVVIEAASVGTPTIAFDVPGLRDSIVDGKTGIICKDKSPVGLAKEVVNLLQDDITYRKLTKYAILWSKKFSWDKAVKISLDLIQSLMAK